jgi:hypothetical protein
MFTKVKQFLVNLFYTNDEMLLIEKEKKFEKDFDKIFKKTLPSNFLKKLKKVLIQMGTVYVMNKFILI